MNKISIYVNTAQEFIKYEMWLFCASPPSDNVEVSISCKETGVTYYYKVIKDFGSLRFVTDGEY